MKLGAVILAAGYSSRMNAFKPLLEIGGISAVVRCVELFASCGLERVVVVTGHCREKVDAAIMDSGARAVFNPDFDRGMFSSIVAGTKEMDGTDGFFLLPVDIPLVRPATVAILQEQFDGTLLLNPSFNNTAGHPPLIPAHHYPSII